MVFGIVWECVVYGMDGMEIGIGIVNGDADCMLDGKSPSLGESEAIDSYWKV